MDIDNTEPKLKTMTLDEYYGCGIRPMNPYDARDGCFYYCLCRGWEVKMGLYHSNGFYFEPMGYIGQSNMVSCIPCDHNGRLFIAMRRRNFFQRLFNL